MENEIKPRLEGDINIPSVGTPPKKSRKLILVILILITLVAIGSIIYWQYIGIPKKDSQTELPEKEESTEEKIGEKGTTFKDVIEKCEGIEGSFKSACIKSVCDVIGITEERIEKCMEKKNVGERDQCLVFIVPTTIEVCNSISDSTRSRNSSKTGCYRGIAEKEGDDSICDKINDDIGQRATCYRIVARIKQDPGICQKIDYDYLKDWCLENSTVNLCMYQLKDFEELDWLDFSIFYPEKDRCLGIATGDISKCGDKETGEKYYCYAEIAEDKNDLSICDKITPEGYRHIREFCYLNIAELRKDASLCDKIIEVQNYKDSCYLLTAEKMDISLCKKQSGEGRDNCYLQLATEEGDASLCGEISEGMWKAYCYRSVVQSIAEELNKNFDEEDQILYNQYCKESEFPE